MDGKSSRNQEIRPLADFKDRAFLLRDAPADLIGPVASKSVNQIIHPFAAFCDVAQLPEDKNAGKSDPTARVDIVIDADIAPYFPTNESVNAALRKWLGIAGLNGNQNATQ